MQAIWAWVLVGVVTLAGCIESKTKVCGAFVCSEASVCAPSGDRCVLPSQLDACAGQATGVSCSYPGTNVGTCDGPVCVPAGCGNGVIEPASEEVCDDGNRDSRDGCSADCRSLERCGDGVAELQFNETCDCGNTTAALGCSGVNSDAAGADCRTDCRLARCGDGVKDPLESCDDGNTVAGDGCRADCTGRWTQMTTDTFAGLHGVWGSGPNDVFAVGVQKILHYDGTAWTAMALPAGQPAQGYAAVWGTAPDNVYAVGGERVDHFDGTSWTAAFTLGFLGRAIAGSSATNIWVVGYNGTNGVAHYNGTSWAIDTTSPQYVIGVFAGSPTDVLALIDTDGTESNVIIGHPPTTTSMWEIETSAALEANLIFSTSATEVYAYVMAPPVEGGHQMRRRSAGTWTSSACCDEIGYEARALGGVAGDLLLVGASGHIVRYDGVSSTISRTPTSESLNAIWGSSVGRAFVVGDNGTILY